MNCPLCERSMQEQRDYYRCRHDHIIMYKNHSNEGTRANLYPNQPVPRINQLIHQISELWKQEYLIFIALVLAYTICMIWIGMLLTPGVIR